MNNVFSLSTVELRDYDKITSALKLRFGDEHLTELLYGQLHQRSQKAKEYLAAFAYEVQRYLNETIDSKDIAPGVTY
ncbi:unnamed protein product [Callosobruchus maculatus]|uniref:Uncharacterized protein n=1 Tax=Callosobruchus maculatus TaxID=64391 RepID=A0A653BPN6_CALMS|nr:unnamed protein product [Callosobruchus maculatus]